ncbi:MAG: hypothetical protein QOI20_1198 [Acidimicrobiaceae bacterium]|jgi:hypothetical protein|nr:hypothetical protein [Acidimicrobiaceae bacterium]
MLRHLPTVIPAPPDRPEIAGPDHPIRVVTRQIAFEPDGWTDDRRGKVAELFDGLAPEWHARDAANRHEAALDALKRGGPFAPGVCIELGSGVGTFTPHLTEHLGPVLVAMDLSFEMLRRAPAAPAWRVLADGSTLPVPTASVAVLVMINMFLFPAEADRVLRPDGAVVWVSAMGDTTPIYLDAESVEAALPGEWDGVAAAAGWGTWSVFRRARG